MNRHMSILSLHFYLNGIDWNEVVEKKMKSPFRPIEIQINDDNRIDLATKFKIDTSEELDQIILGRF